MLDLRLIRYFVAVAETEHVGRAAERLRISQSPLSRQIRQLEGALGLRLFDRERQRVRLTAEGRWLLGEARELLSRAERVERDAARAARGEIGRLVVGFVRSAMWSALLPAALRRFRAARPSVRVELRGLRSGAQIDAVRSGDLDVGLVHFPPHEGALSSARLLDEPYWLAIPKGHAAARKKAIGPKDLDGEPWVVLSPRVYPGTHERLIAACAKAGFAPRVAYDATDPATVLGLVGAGMGLALLEASARSAASKEVVFRELPWFPVSMRTYAVWRNEGASRIAEEFVGTLRAGSG